MRYLIVSFALVSCAIGQNFPQPIEPQYQLEPNSGPVSSGYQIQKLNPDGSYILDYHTDNGISAVETGTANSDPKGADQVVEGLYTYVSDGVKILVTYKADKNGFHPHTELEYPISYHSLPNNG